jgi:cobalt-zinc-cadmium efflux system outer membrane protein
MGARATVLASLLLLLVPAVASAQEPRRVSLDEALRAARAASPDLVVARAREGVARAEVDVAGVYPNPSVAVGTSTQTAPFSATLSLPLVILGQRGAAMDAARADQATVAIDTQVTWNDVRQAAERAYATLWLTEGVVGARRDAASLQATLEAAVVQRVQVGSAPEVDALRVHAEKVRSDADVLEAMAEVSVAASELGHWMGLSDGSDLRSRGDPPAPDTVPSLASLLARLESSAAIRREVSDAHAAEARVARERALVRPSMFLDLGADLGDPTYQNPNAPNYRAQLTFEVPLFNQRGGFIDRELAQGDVARARAQAARIQGASELSAAFRTFDAATARQKTLAESVLPAAQGAAKATEESYVLGRAPLVAVLDAERLLVDVRVTTLEAQAARSIAWATVEHALGAP